MILPLLVGAALLVSPAGEVDRFPKAAASYLVAVDGKVLWSRAADTPRPPASLTKIMSALVLLSENFDPAARVVVSERAAAATGSRAGLRAGESLAAIDLLTAMLVASANDACLALAEHSAGSSERFVAKLNAKAAALGLAATHFDNPCGFDSAGQRSSARDLYRLAEAALALPEFARIVALPSATLSTARGRRITLASGNHLLGNLPGAAGVKTGYTSKAGKCIVALAARNGTRVLVVLLNSKDRWFTAAGIVEEAFDAARRPA